MVVGKPRSKERRDYDKSYRNRPLIREKMLVREKELRTIHRTPEWLEKHQDKQYAPTEEGYRRVSCLPIFHLMADAKGRVLVVAIEIGRPLTKGEVVHHKDGNKTNNAVENLVLYSSEKSHHRACGAIWDGEYNPVDIEVVTKKWVEIFTACMCPSSWGIGVNNESV
jgi:hypothetical protein